MWGNILLSTDIESKLRRIEEDPEGSGTTQLYKCIEGVSSLANRAFQPLFERQVCDTYFWVGNESYIFRARVS